MKHLKPYIEKIKQGKHNVLWKGSQFILQKQAAPQVV